MLEPEKYTEHNAPWRRKNLHTSGERLLYCMLYAVLVALIAGLLLLFRTIGVTRIPLVVLVIALALMIISITIMSIILLVIEIVDCINRHRLERIDLEGNGCTYEKG